MPRAILSVSVNMAIGNALEVLDSKSAIVAALLERAFVDDTSIQDLFKALNGRVKSKVIAKAILGNPAAIMQIVNTSGKIDLISCDRFETKMQVGDEKIVCDSMDYKTIFQTIIKVENQES